MTDQRQGEKFVVKTGDGRNIELRCPVCANNLFITSRAPPSKSGAGFQHVIIGRELVSRRAGPAQSLAVRFQACANCGYIMKFLIDLEERDGNAIPD
jgi:hypothetical protein